MPSPPPKQQQRQQQQPPPQQQQQQQQQSRTDRALEQGSSGRNSAPTDAAQLTRQFRLLTGGAGLTLPLDTFVHEAQQAVPGLPRGLAVALFAGLGAAPAEAGGALALSEGDFVRGMQELRGPKEGRVALLFRGYCAASRMVPIRGPEPGEGAPLHFGDCAGNRGEPFLLSRALQHFAALARRWEKGEGRLRQGDAVVALGARELRAECAKAGIAWTAELEQCAGQEAMVAEAGEASCTLIFLAGARAVCPAEGVVRLTGLEVGKELRDVLKQGAVPAALAGPDRYLGMDVRGQWWPVTLTGPSPTRPKAALRAVVHDASGRDEVVWEALAPEMIDRRISGREFAQWVDSWEQRKGSPPGAVAWAQRFVSPVAPQPALPASSSLRRGPQRRTIGEATGLADCDLQELLEGCRRLREAGCGAAVTEAALGQALPLVSAPLRPKLIQALQRGGAGPVSAAEVVALAATCTRAKMEDKVRCCFQLFDEEGTGQLRKEQFVPMLRSMWALEALWRDATGAATSVAEPRFGDLQGTAFPGGAQRIHLHELQAWAKADDIAREFYAALGQLLRVDLYPKPRTPAEEWAVVDQLNTPKYAPEDPGPVGQVWNLLDAKWWAAWRAGCGQRRGSCSQGSARGIKVTVEGPSRKEDLIVQPGGTVQDVRDAAGLKPGQKLSFRGKDLGDSTQGLAAAGVQAGSVLSAGSAADAALPSDAAPGTAALGPPDCSSLLDEHGGLIRPGGQDLVWRRDYVVITPAAWRALVAWHQHPIALGGSETPEVTRRVVDTLQGTKVRHLELYPPRLRIARGRPGAPEEGGARHGSFNRAPTDSSGRGEAPRRELQVASEIWRADCFSHGATTAEVLEKAAQRFGVAYDHALLWHLRGDGQWRRVGHRRGETLLDLDLDDSSLLLLEELFVPPVEFLDPVTRRDRYCFRPDARGGASCIVQSAAAAERALSPSTEALDNPFQEALLQGPDAARPHCPGSWVLTLTHRGRWLPALQLHKGAPLQADDVVRLAVGASRNGGALAEDSVGRVLRATATEAVIRVECEEDSYATKDLEALNVVVTHVPFPTRVVGGKVVPELEVLQKLMDLFETAEPLVRHNFLEVIEDFFAQAAETSMPNASLRRSVSVDPQADQLLAGVRVICRMPDPKGGAEQDVEGTVLDGSGEPVRVLLPKRDKEVVIPRSAITRVRRQEEFGELGSYGLVGLGNMGNTCYINSTMQALSHTRLLREYFLGGMYRLDLNVADSQRGMQGKLAVGLAEFFQSTWSGYDYEGHYFQPRSFRRLVGKYRPSSFGSTRQQDADEFLRALILCLTEDTRRMHPRAQQAGGVQASPQRQQSVSGGSRGELDAEEQRADAELAREAWSALVEGEDSFITSVFAAMDRIERTCRACGRLNSRRFDIAHAPLCLPLAGDRRSFVEVLLHRADCVLRAGVVLEAGAAADRLREELAALFGEGSLSASAPASAVSTTPDKGDFVVTGPTWQGPLLALSDTAWSASETVDGDCTLTVFEAEGFTAAYGTERERVVVPAVHRVLERSRSIFGPQWRAALLGSPLLLCVRKGGTAQELYEAVWQRVRWVLAPGGTAGSGPQRRGSGTKYPFVLSQVRSDGKWCAMCSYFSGCVGCPLDPSAPHGIDGSWTALLAVTWESEAHVAQVRSGASLRVEDHSSVWQMRELREKARGATRCVERYLEQYYTSDDMCVLKCKKCGERKSLELSKQDFSELRGGLRYDESEIRITRVPRKSAAHAAGINDSMHLLGLNGTAVKDDKDVTRALAQGSGGKVTLEVVSRNTPHTEQRRLWTYPALLVLQLVRFDREGGAQRKIEWLVDFPVDRPLDLSPFRCEGDGRPGEGAEEGRFLHRREGNGLYDLYAVVNHTGSCNGGHYYAYVRSGTQWWEMNDRIVKKLASGVVTKEAYLLFYRRRDAAAVAIKSFWSPPPGAGNLSQAMLDDRVAQVKRTVTPKRIEPSAPPRRGAAAAGGCCGGPQRPPAAGRGSGRTTQALTRPPRKGSGSGGCECAVA